MRFANFLRLAGAIRPWRSNKRQNRGMHRRLDFKQADPSWDELEAQWMATLAVGGTGAEEAIAALFRAYNPLFVKRLRWFGLSEAEAEDAAQGLWMDVARAAPSYVPLAPVRHLFNRFLDIARLRSFSERGGQPRFESLSVEGVEEAMDAALRWLAPSVGSESEWFDFMRCVRRALEKFERKHPRLAKLLLIRHVEELSLEEAAALLGGSADQAKAEVFSARRKFEPGLSPCLKLWPNRQLRGSDER